MLRITFNIDLEAPSKNALPSASNGKQTSIHRYPTHLHKNEGSLETYILAYFLSHFREGLLITYKETGRINLITKAVIDFIPLLRFVGHRRDRLALGWKF